MTLPIPYHSVEAPPCAHISCVGTYTLYTWIMTQKWGTFPYGKRYPRRINDYVNPSIPTNGTVKPSGFTRTENVSCRHVNNDPSKPMSIHSDGRAADVGMPIIFGMYYKSLGTAIANFLVAKASLLQIQSIVFWERDWNPSDGWTKYGGSRDHHDHLHFEQNKIGANFSESQILTIVGDLNIQKEISMSRIILHPEIGTNPAAGKFARLLPDNKTIRGVNGALISNGDGGKTQITMPFEIEELKEHPVSKNVFIAVQKGGGRTDGLRFV